MLNSIQLSDAISSLALLVSVAGVLWTVIQNRVAAASANRKLFNDLVLELTNVAVAFEQINLTPSGQSPQLVPMRRVLNSRRRFLVDCADRLLLGIASLVTDGEYQILAVAWDSVGDHEKARDCWAKCVERSPNDAMRIFNLRGYARYLYRIGQAATGRETYGKAVSIETADTDTARQTKADTYLMWAKTEEQYGYLDEARRLLAFGRNEIERVGFEPSRKQLRARVEHDFVALIKTSPPQGPEQAGPAAG